MAIKDLFTRKSVSSSSSGGHTEATMTTTTSTSDDGGGQDAPSSPTAQRPSNRLAKTWSWRSNKAFKEEKKPKPQAKPKARKQQQPPQRVHPSERPLTEGNLRHQEMLSSFTFSFGSRRKGSNAGRTSFSGVSPGNSRHASWDQSSAADSPGMGPVRGDRRVSSFAHDVPREDPRAEAEAE